jgi:undecaprenyl diphosphate synthase
LEETSVCTGTTVVLALSYSSRWELARAAKNIAIGVESGEINIEDIKETTIPQYLSTRDIPDPDVLIRTGGELRISNFLLWQIAYSELYFTDELWPDFNEESLYKAVVDFQNRERRFGKTSEQVSDKS